MPVCVSCRGDYWAPPEDRQQKEEQAPETAPSALDELLSPEEDQESEANTAKAATPPYVCARCHQNNRRWHEWDTAGGGAHFGRFFFRGIPWGWLALISFLLPLVVFVAADAFTPVASVRIGIPLAILLIFVNVALLYALKDSLWRYDVLSQVKRGGFRPPLSAWAVTFFVLGLVFGLALVFMIEARAGDPEAGPTEGLVRVLTTVLLALSFVNVTLSAMFMAAHEYGRWLDREMPQPIYAQESRLLGVVEDGVRDRIGQATGRPEQGVAVTIVDIERTRDGGVDLVVSAEIDADGNGWLKKMQDWKISADRWGRLKKMNRSGIPQYVELPPDESAEAITAEATG